MSKRIRHMWLLIFILAIRCSEEETPPKEEKEEEKEEVILSLVDNQATEETKALYANLWAQQTKGFMFGHHDDLMYGRDWYTDQDGSDTKEVCGDYPGVYSLDFAQIMDDRFDSHDLNDDRKRTILEARARGEVITACIHINNPLTGGDSWDNSNTQVVAEILKAGSETNIKYKIWLDRLASFVTDLKDGNGKLIPIIFRPYHEHTQTWSWWSRSCTSEEEFIGLWKFTVDYLTNDKGVHNLIYAISPQLDGTGTVESLLFRWPGDDYVDFIGMDSYNGFNDGALATNVKNLETLSKEKLKPCGITEMGVEGIRQNGSDYSKYWTEQILTPIAGKDISMVVMWRNKYDPTHSGHHFYGPWAGHNSAKDFVKFYESSFTLFSQDLPNMYEAVEGVTVQ